MKAWEKMYESDVLDEGFKLSEEVVIKENDGEEIIGEVDNFKVKTIIEFGNPSYLSCSCASNLQCKHQAALVYYLINHPELYMKELPFDELYELVSDDDLRKFLLDEFKSNQDMKDRFYTRFCQNTINRNHYQSKLSKVFKSGEGRDFKHHGIYDLDLMEDELYDFIFNDISDVLTAGDVDFACDLLIRIAKLLNDEMMVDYDSWYNLVDRFFEKESVLSVSIYLDGEKLDELYENIDVILDCF